MADVDMTDAALTPSAESKAKAKVAKSGAAEGQVDNKKRFEVKKVGRYCHNNTTILIALSGTPLLYGHGILWSITAPSAAIILWICVSTECGPLSLLLINRQASNVRQTRDRRPTKNVPLPGVSATTPSTFTASHAGSRLDKSAPSITETGSSKSMAGNF